MTTNKLFVTNNVLLYTQPSVAQKSVTDTVRLNFNIDSVALEEVVVKGARTPAANSRWSDMHSINKSLRLVTASTTYQQFTGFTLLAAVTLHLCSVG